MNLLKSLTERFMKKPENKEMTTMPIASQEEIIEVPKGFRKNPGSELYYPPKLNDEMQLYLLNLIAQGLISSQISDKMKEAYGVVVSSGLIYQYEHTPKWEKKLGDLRKSYRDRLDLIDGSHKSTRIRRMEQVMDKANKKGDLKAAISANEQIRKEFQEDGASTTQVFWNNPIYQQFSNLSNEELLKLQKEATEKLMNKEE